MFKKNGEMNIKNKNILITGTENGIGKYLATEVSGMGANIIAIDINKDALNSLTGNSASIRHYVCDLRDSENIRKVHNIICEDYSNIDVLINNAGIMYSNPIIKMDNNGISEHSFEDWDNVIASNLSSAFYLTSLTVREMVKKRVKGLIINFSSVSAKGNIGQAAYSASKAGLEAFTKSLSKEIGLNENFPYMLMTVGHLGSHGTRWAAQGPFGFPREPQGTPGNPREPRAQK